LGQNGWMDGWVNAFVLDWKEGNMTTNQNFQIKN
jgi:hypothetical protein